MTFLASELTVPLYTIAEASRILHLPPQTLAGWARGYNYALRNGERRSAGALVTEYGPGPRHVPTVPFVGLAEAAFLASVRARGVTMQRIRPALAEISRKIGLEHALASEALFTDGDEILIDLGRAGLVDVEPFEQLVVARSNQGVFVPVIKQFLSHITYGPSGYAEAITLPGFARTSVAVSPTIAFGKPHFTDSGVQTDAVLDRFWAGDSIDELVEDFALTDTAIEDLLRAETRLVSA